MSSQWRLDGGHADGGQPSPDQTHPLAELRVLIIDGNRDAADSLALLVHLWGHAVRVAYSPADALEAVASFHPAVVISEIILPRQNGCELARQFRQQHPEVLLVALTSLGRPADRIRTREAGFDLHLVKPADPLDLHQLLRQQAAENGPFKEEEATPPRPAGPLIRR